MSETTETSRAPRTETRAEQVTYSPWQLEMIKAALRAHKAYTLTEDGRPLTWPWIAFTIEEDFGTKMTPEVLRQFVDGVVKSDPSRTRVPSKKNLETIVEYLAHPKVDALSLDELDEDRFQYQIPLRLMTYLRQNIDENVVVAPCDLNGKYLAIGRGRRRSERFTLELTVKDNDGYIEVTEKRSIKEKEDRTQRISMGWAVYTPEGNLLCFMKDLPFNRNHYWTKAAEILDSPTPLNQLALLRHEYPPEFDHSYIDIAELNSAMQDYVSENIFLFQREKPLHT